MTSPKQPASMKFYDHSSDPWFKNKFIEPSGVTVKPVPVYSKQRQGKFGDIDGGAFPDLNYNKYNKPSSSRQKSAGRAKERNRRTLEMSLDPLDPSNSSKHTRGPKSFGSLPVPVVDLPPRPDVTVKNRKQGWTIPPCISNWDNATGEFDDRRYIYDCEINNNFAKVRQVLIVAEHRAIEAIAMRSEVQKEMEKERKEQELRDLAQKHRCATNGATTSGDSET